MVPCRTIKTQQPICMLKWFFVWWNGSSDWWRMYCRWFYIAPKRGSSIVTMSGCQNVTGSRGWFDFCWKEKMALLTIWVATPGLAFSEVIQTHLVMLRSGLWGGQSIVQLLLFDLSPDGDSFCGVPGARSISKRCTAFPVWTCFIKTVRNSV